MPPPVWHAWMDLCETSQAESSAALRDLLHRYLCSRKEPGRIEERWTVNGRLYKARQPECIIEWFLVPKGARDALNVRAVSHGVDSHTILRGLVTDALEGRRRIERPIQSMAMFNDPKRYEVAAAGIEPAKPGL